MSEDEGLKPETAVCSSMSVYEQLLVADFNQSCELVRHYEEGFRKMMEYSFTVTAAVVAAYAALILHFGVTPRTRTLGGLALVLTALAGIMILMSLARNRVFFTFTCRHVNAIRRVYVDRRPGGFDNKAGFYTDHRRPKIYDPASPHTLQLYFFAFFNALLFAAAVETLPIVDADAKLLTVAGNVWWGLVVVVGFFIVQVGMVLDYWAKKEKRRYAQVAIFAEEL